jgi:hypothetical protein
MKVHSLTFKDLNGDGQLDLCPGPAVDSGRRPG